MNAKYVQFEKDKPRIQQNKNKKPGDREILANNPDMISTEKECK